VPENCCCGEMVFLAVVEIMVDVLKEEDQHIGKIA
jgi:hypothetical protein